MKLTNEQWALVPDELKREAIEYLIGWRNGESDLVVDMLSKTIKSKLKPVDMSVLVGSGVDCVFCDCKDFKGMEFHYSMLDKIKLPEKSALDTLYVSYNNVPWFYCKPRMNYWFSFHNFEVSTPLIRRDLHDAGFDADLDAKDFSFIINGLREGYCWPWEVYL